MILNYLYIFKSNTIFKKIVTYIKGAAILYMLEKFLGLETLRSGLNDYLNTHKYGNADTTDLWSVLSLHAKNTVQVRVSESYYATTRRSPDYLVSFF